MKPLYFATAIALLASCSHKPATVKRKDSTLEFKRVVKNSVIDTLSPVPDTTKELLNYSLSYYFSDTLQKDKFSITLFGKSISNGVIVFEIYDHTRHQLFKETYPSTDFLGDMADVLNYKQQTDTIKSRMATFFDTSNFNTPAINNKETIADDIDEPDKTDKENWNDIKADPTSVRFIYSHGYESTFGIAYSKKKKKVVTIFVSD